VNQPEGCRDRSAQVLAPELDQLQGAGSCDSVNCNHILPEDGPSDHYQVFPTTGPRRHDSVSIPLQQPADSPRITVVGSLNVDLVVSCRRLPRPGETISAQRLRQMPGGKGANQAVAAARAGGRVTMIGCVGNDSFGERLLGQLRQEGIDTAAVAIIEDCESGVAIIGVDDHGENAILVVPGANGRLTPEHVRSATPAIETADILLVQLETPLEAVREAIGIARAAGVRVMLDPAPAIPLPNDLLQVDLLCPNESEAGVLSGLPVETPAEIETAARHLQHQGPRAVVITLGSNGAVLCDAHELVRIPTSPTAAVDTTAAGDAFAGALAVRWLETDDLRQSIEWANAAGGLATTLAGAQPSLPFREAINLAWTTSPTGAGGSRGAISAG